MNPLNETVFEEHIAEYLAASPLYNQRKSSQFDIDNLVDREMLEHFLHKLRLGRDFNTISRAEKQKLLLPR